MVTFRAQIYYALSRVIAEFLKEIGKLEPFELRNSSMFFSLGGPCIYIYVLIMLHYNPNLIIPYYGKEVFSILFLFIGVLPFFKNKIIIKNYGWIIFITLIVFQFYLTYTTALNNFSLDYLLVTYIFIFGAILLLSNRFLIILFSTIQLLHIAFRVLQSDLDSISKNAIVLSMSVIFIFSFLVMNGLTRYRKNLRTINLELERKIKERTLDLEQRAKELLGKNKDLEEFAYVVSHDLKRPLRNIYTLTDWLTEDESILNDEVTTNLQLIKEQVIQMDLLVEGILNYSLQMEKGHILKEVDVQELVERIISVNVEENCEITIKQKLPVITFNESQLIQVFQNLIQNAIKHNDKDIAIIDIAYKLIENEHQFSISDNGPGIDIKYHDKIFQLFQKLDVKSGIESIGIGLALVKKIIERNGGKIYVESKIGHGTTFFFTIRE